MRSILAYAWYALFLALAIMSMVGAKDRTHYETLNIKNTASLDDVKHCE